MPLQTQTYEQLLSNIITSWASLLQTTPNLPDGDPLKAIFQANVLCGIIFLQSQIVTTSNLTRAATSSGADLDSWMADYGFDRKESTTASGSVQFSVRNVSSGNILIAAGTIIQTLDGTIQYQVIGDTAQSGWSASQNAYVLTAGSLSVNATVEAMTAGSASNVQVGALSQIVSALPGINFVTNLAAIENGTDAEQDQPYRDRFKLSFNTTNAKTTPGGVLAAALNTPGVVSAALIENQDRYGNTRLGYGVIVIDDGSGSPSSTLISAVRNAVSAVNAPVRGFTINSLVIGPTLSQVTIALNVKINPNAVSATVLLNVENAIIDYVNSLAIGAPLYLNSLVFVACSADPNVLTVQPGSLTINGSAADFSVASIGVIRTNNTMVTVGTY